MTKKNQVREVLEYIQKHGRITSKEAFEKLGVTRLSAKIYMLKNLKCYRDVGITVKDYWVDVPTRHGDTVKVKNYTIERNYKN